MSEVVVRDKTSRPVLGVSDDGLSLDLFGRLIGVAGFAGGAVISPVLGPDGTALLAAYSFTSEPTLGFWRSGAGQVTAQGNLAASGSVIATGAFTVSARFVFRSPVAGVMNLSNTAEAIGSQLKVDALPTVASGFGTGPSVTAGSTPLAGSVNVGTGGSATTGVINFNGTPFPSAPFVVCMNTTTGAVVRAVASTTQLTITAPAAFTASDVIAWIAISSK